MTTIPEHREECERNCELIRRERRRNLVMLVVILAALAFIVYTHVEAILWLMSKH